MKMCNLCLFVEVDVEAAAVFWLFGSEFDIVNFYQSTIYQFQEFPLFCYFKLSLKLKFLQS